MAKISDLPPEVLSRIFEFTDYTGDVFITDNACKQYKTDVDKTDNIDFGASSSLVHGCRRSKEVTCWLAHIKKYLRDEACHVEVNVQSLDFGNFIRYIKAMRKKNTLGRFAYNFYSRGAPTCRIRINHTITSDLETHPTSLNTFLKLMAKIKKEDGYDLDIVHDIENVLDYQALNNFVAARSHQDAYEHEFQHALLFREFKKNLEEVLNGDDGHEDDEEDVEMMDAEGEDDVEIKVEEDEMTGMEDVAGIETDEEVGLNDGGFPAVVDGYEDYQPLYIQDLDGQVYDYDAMLAWNAAATSGIYGVDGFL